MDADNDDYVLEEEQPKPVARGRTVVKSLAGTPVAELPSTAEEPEGETEVEPDEAPAEEVAEPVAEAVPVF